MSDGILVRRVIGWTHDLAIWNDAMDAVAERIMAEDTVEQVARAMRDSACRLHPGVDWPTWNEASTDVRDNYRAEARSLLTTLAGGDQ